MYEISKVALSETCGQLYYQKQVYNAGSYVLSSISSQIQCKFNEPVKMIAGSYNHNSEKLAQTALIFSDQLSHLQPSEGIKVHSCPSLPCSSSTNIMENIFESNIHYLTFPWTMSSGWNLDKTSVNSFIIDFGTPPRTVFIWGMQFLKDQFKGILKVSLKTNYFKDVENGKYKAFQWLSPDKLENTKIELEISPGDLDDSGVFRFTDPEDPQKPLMFIASKIRFTKISGPTLLNFDFIGTYYDFDTAVDGKHANGANDNWNDPVLGQYFTKGKK